MKHIKLFEQFVGEAKGELTLTPRQTKKIAEWKDSADRIWYSETYKWLWKNASKFMKAKSVDDILKLNVGSFKPELVIQGAYIRQYGDTPTTYEDLVKMLKGIDTSKMGYSGQGKEFDVYLGEYPGRNTSQDCGTVYATLAYDGKKDKLSSRCKECKNKRQTELYRLNDYLHNPKYVETRRRGERSRSLKLKIFLTKLIVAILILA